MNRRDFLRLLGAGAATTAAGLVLAPVERVRRYWQVPRNAPVGEGTRIPSASEVVMRAESGLYEPRLFGIDAPGYQPISNRYPWDAGLTREPVIYVNAETWNALNEELAENDRTMHTLLCEELHKQLDSIHRGIAANLDAMDEAGATVRIDERIPASVGYLTKAKPPLWDLYSDVVGGGFTRELIGAGKGKQS